DHGRARLVREASRGAEAAGRNAVQLVARGDLELLEDVAQVVLHRTRADEQLRADLGVGKPIASETCDLRLLGGEHAPRVLRASPHGLARGEELEPCTFGKSVGLEATEHVVGGSELVTRLRASVLTT